jgi:hypothetical protein
MEVFTALVRAKLFMVGRDGSKSCLAILADAHREFPQNFLKNFLKNFLTRANITTCFPLTKEKIF